MTTSEIEERVQAAEQYLSQAINDTLREEFASMGYTSASGLNVVLSVIRNGEFINYHFIPVPGVSHTYKLIWRDDNYCFVNERQKGVIEKQLNNMTTELVEAPSDNPLTEEEQALLDQAVEEAHQEIPANSATLLVDEATSRFSSAIWYEKIQEKTIVLAGVGGIGRFGNLINFYYLCA